MKAFFPILCLFLLLVAGTALAGSATWNLNPTSGAWNTATNWTPNTVPNGPADIATFGVSNNTNISLSGSIEVDSIVFNAGASAFTITCPLGFFTFEGGGVTNNSQIAQNFVATSSVVFTTGIFDFNNNATAGNATFTNRCDAGPCGESNFDGTSTAGDATFVNEPGGAGAGGNMTFETSSTAGNSTIITNGGSDSALGAGFVQFNGESSAGNSTMITNGAANSAALGGSVEFATNSTASSAVITANGGTVSSAPGGKISLVSSATADQATLIANGGTNGGQGGIISFLEGSTGGTARVQVFGNGTLDISAHDAPSLAIGSLEGSGSVSLGGGRLTVGTNNLSTSFSGVIAGAGSLIKAGSGTFKITGANTYTGVTTVSAGVLRVANRTGSATGTGAVNVNAGTLGGRGTIVGASNFGTGTGAGAFLTPSVGASQPSILTIQGLLTFEADSTYTYKLNTKEARGDQVVATGVSIQSGAQFSFNAISNKRLHQGQTFTAILNISASPISGTFANLADGSMLTAGRNKFQASYSGGDGNDLTLTVVP